MTTLSGGVRWPNQPDWPKWAETDLALPHTMFGKGQ